MSSFLENESQCACKNKLVFVCKIEVAPFITWQKKEEKRRSHECEDKTMLKNKLSSHSNQIMKQNTIYKN